MFSMLVWCCIYKLHMLNIIYFNGPGWAMGPNFPEVYGPFLGWAYERRVWAGPGQGFMGPW